MSLFPRFSLLKWTVALLVLVGLLAGAYLVHDRMKSERAAEAGDAKDREPRRDEQGEQDEQKEPRVVQLDEEQAEAHGIKDELAQAVSWLPHVLVYGRVVPNPQATTEVRSPFAGTLRATLDNPWPTPGRWVRAGQVLGRLDIRLGPQERLDLQAKLNDARLKQQGAAEVLQVQQERVDRLQKAGLSQVVSRKELDDALVAVADARTQLATAQAEMELWQNALAALQRENERPTSAWAEPLTSPAEGEVTELVAKPGMAVEAGGLIIRLVDFRRPLVRLDVPPEALAAGPPAQVELVTDTAGPTTLAATLVGPAPQVDTTSQFSGYWYQVRGKMPEADSAATGPGHGSMAWRPGLFVQASVPGSGGEPRKAVAVPETALLYHQGRPCLYVRLAADKFERREVQVLGRKGKRFVLALGVAAGESVVYRQAQLLLGQEFKGEGGDND